MVVDGTVRWDGDIEGKGVRTFQTRGGFEQKSRSRNRLGRVSGWHGGLRDGISGRRRAG